MSPVVARLLFPLGWLYGLAGAVRVQAYRRGWLARARLRGPVISVGNLSLGGSGKTPMIQHLAAQLCAQGVSVAILSRGYGGSFRGVALFVSDGRELLADAALAGDEPVMLARSLPGVVVAVGARRDLVGREVEARFGPRVHLLDDGFQHLRLERDLDLLCIDATDDSRWPVPAGRLREWPRSARRADLVLVTNAERVSPARLADLVQTHGHERTWSVRRSAPTCIELHSSAGVAAPRRPWLVSGLARPAHFEADARLACGAIAGHSAFRDHHAFTPAELAAVHERARGHGADALLTTAKDAVRWPSGPALLPVRVLHSQLVIDGEPQLIERVLAVARRAA